jgi:hypothetical protein
LAVWKMAFRLSKKSRTATLLALIRAVPAPNSTGLTASAGRGTVQNRPPG